MSNDPLQDALDLLADGEPALALEQLNQLLREEPYHGALRALRGLVLLDLGKSQEADQDIREALEAAPDHPFVHYAAGAVALEAGEVQAAISAALTARNLAPEYHDAILLEARARAAAGQWAQVVRLARHVAEADPDNDEAAILAELAGAAERDAPLDHQAWADLSARFPLNPAARTGAGWTRLRAGQIRDAKEEFEQALALDPSLEWAKEGLATALKARNPLYRLLLRYFLWSATLSPRTRNLMAIGGVLGYNFLRRLGRENPALEPFVIPLLIAYGLFVFGSWLADPLLDLTLMLRSESRRLVLPEDRRVALAVAACLASAGMFALVAVLLPWSGAFLIALPLAFLCLPLIATLRTPPSDKRDRLAIMTGAALILAIAAGVVPEDYRSVSLVLSILLSAAATWYHRFGKVSPRPSADLV